MSEIKRDRWGRPMIPDPTTGKVIAWTRATTLAGTISDRWALEKWAQRNIVKGFALREDLVLRASAAGDDRDALDKVAQAASEAANSSSAADIGTALHSITEKLDGGEDVDVPSRFKPDVDAYQKAMAESGLRVMKGWIERFVVVPEVKAAGTPDRLLEPAEIGLPMIGDLKTGANAVKFGMVEIAAQMAIYAHASHWWDGEKLHPMPKVDQALGVVFHMPAGEGTCTLYGVDLVTGWEIAKHCVETRRLRSVSGLATELTAVSTVNIERDLAVRERVRDIVRALEGADLPHPWPAWITPIKRHESPYSSDELDAIDRWCDRCASSTTAPAH